MQLAFVGLTVCSLLVAATHGATLHLKGLRQGFSKEIPDSIGCFKDTADFRDLPVLAKKGVVDILQCLHMCRGLSYRYFGVQYGTECWCGNSYGQHGRVKDSECGILCSGSRLQTCGGRWRNRIYPTKPEKKNATKVASGPIKFLYIGCFLDSVERDLPHMISSGTVTVASCGAGCSAQGYRYFGLQNGHQCWCGKSFGSYGSSKTGCKTPCSGDPGKICGGAYYNSVYATSAENLRKAVASQLEIKQSSTYKQFRKIAKANLSGSQKSIFSVGLVSKSTIKRTPTLLKKKQQVRSKGTKQVKKRVVLKGTKQVKKRVVLKGKKQVKKRVVLKGKKQVKKRVVLKGKKQVKKRVVWNGTKQVKKRVVLKGTKQVKKRVVLKGKKLVKKRVVLKGKKQVKKQLFRREKHTKKRAYDIKNYGKERVFKVKKDGKNRVLKIKKHGKERIFKVKKYGQKRHKRHGMKRSKKVRKTKRQTVKILMTQKLKKKQMLKQYATILGGKVSERYVFNKKKKFSSKLGVKKIHLVKVKNHGTKQVHKVKKHGKKRVFKVKGTGKKHVVKIKKNDKKQTLRTPTQPALKIKRKIFGGSKTTKSKKQVQKQYGAILGGKTSGRYVFTRKKKFSLGPKVKKPKEVLKKTSKLKAVVKSSAAEKQKISIRVTGKVSTLRSSTLVSGKNSASSDLQSTKPSQIRAVTKTQTVRGVSTGSKAQSVRASVASAATSGGSADHSTVHTVTTFETKTIVSEAQGLGCYKDSQPRDLPIFGGSGDMTVEKCLKACTKRKFRYFGLQGGDQCWCGNSYGNYSNEAADDLHCSLKCTGNKAEFCGGHSYNSLYDAGNV